jgi:magnesium-protoporphyrin O-methyltransferase
MENNTFGEDEAKANLKDYRKRGPAKQTKLILEAVRSLGLKDAALLDIGGGIGTIHHELLKDVASEATHVDASSAYLKIATEEAKRVGHEAQVKFIHADFTDVADELPQVDVVTLDRVVCCYPNMRALLKAASSKSRTAIAMTYPRMCSDEPPSPLFRAEKTRLGVCPPVSRQLLIAERMYGDPQGCQ